jgi:putative lipoic acid-binding regulatory protein
MTVDLNEYELVFPCEYPVKLIGRHEDDFFEFVFDLLSHHVPEITRSDLSTNISNGGKYLAVSATFIAQSREQVDALYNEISTHTRVLVSM